LKAAGLRVEANLSSDRMNAKIRAAQLMKVPYMLVLGDNEMANGTVSLRKRDGSRVNDLTVDGFQALALAKYATRDAAL
jgi:threonyl-tRNA synthetase